jgi:hypothetical protein
MPRRADLSCRCSKFVRSPSLMSECGGRRTLRRRFPDIAVVKTTDTWILGPCGQFSGSLVVYMAWSETNGDKS